MGQPSFLEFSDHNDVAHVPENFALFDVLLDLGDADRKNPIDDIGVQRPIVPADVRVTLHVRVTGVRSDRDE
jgi:hypothetical protein